LGYWRLARHSAHVVTISDFCRRDIHAKLGIPLDRITVAKCALDEEFRHLLPESVPEVAPPYLLSVAAAHPHKALPTLVEAFEIIAPDYPALRLALAGTHPAPRRDVARLRARVAASPVAARIQLLPPLDRARIVALFANAATYVSASRFEGFGIPVMEAMSLGCPVAAAPAEAVREVLGDHGTVAADFSARALSEAMRQALTTVAADSGRRDAGAQYVRRTFTWEATAAAIEAALFGGDAAG
jgi:glycosyltransferase involved in cell wall biosynthesis